MEQNLKDLGGLIKDLGVPDSGSIYFAFKTPGLDISGRPVYGIEGRLQEVGQDYISIARSTGEPVIVPREQIAYISPKPLPTNFESLPSNIVPPLTTVEERLFDYMLQNDRADNQGLMEAASLKSEGLGTLRGHIMNLRKKLKETPYQIITIRGKGYSLKFTPEQKSA